MTLLIIIASAVFTLVAAYHLIIPFLSSRKDQLRFEVLDQDLRRVEELVARKSTLLQTLRDVEFDFETDKISERDYTELKQRYERQAVEVMRDLDEVHGGRGWEEAIDAELGRRLAAVKAKRQADPTSDDTTAATASPASVTVCPDCSKEMESDARFCSQCGATMADEDEPAEDEAVEDEAVEDEAAEDEAAASNTNDNPAPIESHALPRSGSEVAS